VSSTFTRDPATPDAQSLSLTVNTPGSDFVIVPGNGSAVPYSMYIPAGLQAMMMNPLIVKTETKIINSQSARRRNERLQQNFRKKNPDL
jgi:hypothetical protein